uniref:Large ribosomal subunit protein bL35m n=1 Tax=Salvator merianae TaxID=96440 RepID=A0A8D0DTF7_SALMN
MMAAVAARRLSGVLRPFCSLVPAAYNGSCNIRPISRLSSFQTNQGHVPIISNRKPLHSIGSSSCIQPVSILNSVMPQLHSILHQQVRTLIKFSLRKGKKKTVKAVVKRFLRLHCGLWLRRKAGYKKKLWKKSASRKKRLREHVFCNKTQSKLLNKMTSAFWKRRNWGPTKGIA